jgi:hypothetical protein
MKTIAVLTILFLPGTFVATVLSIDMFQWQNGDDSEPKVSNLFWIYWVIALPLTALVMAGWLFWTRKSVSRLRQWNDGRLAEAEMGLQDKRD